MSILHTERFPNKKTGKIGDIAFYEAALSQRLLIKGKRGWYQTADLEPARLGLTRSAEVSSFSMKGNIILGSNKIVANKSLREGITLDASRKTVIVDSSNGLVATNSIALAKASFSKLYFDNYSGNDYMMSVGDKIDTYVGGSGMLRLQKSTETTVANSGMVVPFLTNIIFSQTESLTANSGNQDDDSMMIKRSGSTGLPGDNLEFYNNNKLGVAIGLSSDLSGQINIYEATPVSGSHHYIAFKGAATMAAANTYTLPNAFPSGSSKVLQSTTTGVLSWVDDNELTTEEVQDIVGAMFSSNTETRISATYEDGDGTIDLVVDAFPITALNNATANELVTVGSTTTELDCESTLTYTANALVVSGADSTIGVGAPTSDHGYDLDIYASNGGGTDKTGGDVYINAGRGTGNAYGGSIYFTTSVKSASTAVTVRNEIVTGYLNYDGKLRLNSQDGTPGEFQTYNTDGTTYATLKGTGLYSNQALSVDGGNGAVTIDDDGHTYVTFEEDGSIMKIHEDGQDASGKHFKIACGANGATTISTVNTIASTAHLTISPKGQLILESQGAISEIPIKCEDQLLIKEIADASADVAGYGQLWVHDDTPNTLWFTNDAGTDYQIGPTPGAILDYGCWRHTDGTAGEDSITIGTTMTVLETAAGNKINTSFVAPPGGNVEIVFSCMIFGGSFSAGREVMFSLSDNATHNEVAPMHTYDNYSWKNDESDYEFLNVHWVVTGLTAGNAYQYWVSADSSAASAYIYHGNNRTDLNSPPITIKTIALPQTITTGQ